MIKNLRVSFLFTRTVLDIFDVNIQTNSRYDLKDNNSIKQILNKLNNGQKDENDCCPWAYPWESDLSRSHFWNYYLEGCPLTGKTLQMYKVPIFYKIKNYSIKFKSDKFKSDKFKSDIADSIKFSIKPYFYQHGIGLIISTFIPMENEESSIRKVNTIINELYNGEKYSLKYCEIEEKSKKLTEVASVLLDYFETKIFQVDNQNNRIADRDPFSVIAISSNDEINVEQRDLFSTEMLQLCLKQVKKGTIPTHDKNLGIEMHYSSKSRLIWKWDKLEQNGTIKCYYMNISKLTLQIQSLADLLTNYARMNVFENLEHLQYMGFLRIYLCEIYDQLDKICGGKNQLNNSTYRSKSAIFQINDNYLESIDILANELNKPIIMNAEFENTRTNN